jgi:hypothetical protein
MRCIQNISLSKTDPFIRVRDGTDISTGAGYKLAIAGGKKYDRSEQNYLPRIKWRRYFYR